MLFRSLYESSSEGSVSQEGGSDDEDETEQPVDAQKSPNSQDVQPDIEADGDFE